MTDELDAICADYLTQLTAALGGLPRDDRQQLVEQIAEHISSARAALPRQTEAGVRGILERLGPPEEIAAAALAESQPRVRRTTRSPMVLGAMVIALGLLGLVLAAAAGAFSGGTNAPSRQQSAASTTSTARASIRVAVPVVTGVQVPTAAESLASSGLRYSLRYTTSDRPLGIVVGQRPDSGSFVHPGTDVVLVVSGTPTSVTVPNVMGESQAQAESTLQAAGLDVTIVGPVPNKQVPVGIVFTQAPVAGSRVVGRSTVSITVSAGPG
jgi:hypothetical protein